MSRKTKTIPCLKIPAADWLREESVREWKDEENSVATWNRSDNSAYLDIFTTYDQGEGCDKDTMPEWLWDRIEEAAKDAGCEYCVVWLEDIEP